MVIPVEDASDTMCDHEFNILFVGEKGIGKTSLILRLVSQSFTPNLPVTLVLSFRETVVVTRGMNIRLRFWDTPGHESTRNFPPNFFRRVDLVAIVFDHTNRQSFLNLDEWRALVRRSAGIFVEICIVGTKCDAENRFVSSDEVSEYTERNQVVTFETSALTGEGVDIFKQKMALQLLLVVERFGHLYFDGNERERNRRLSNRPSLGRTCCGGRRRSPSPSPSSPLNVLPEPRVTPSTPSAVDIPAGLQNLLAHSLSTMRAEGSANEYEAVTQFRDETQEDNPRPSTDTSLDENPAPVVPPVESAVDTAPATSSTIGDGGEHDPEASRLVVEADSESSTVESGLMVSPPAVAGSSTNGTVAPRTPIMTPD